MLQLKVDLIDNPHDLFWETIQDLSLEYLDYSSRTYFYYASLILHMVAPFYRMSRSPEIYILSNPKNMSDKHFGMSRSYLEFVMQVLVPLLGSPKDKSMETQFCDFL